MSESLYILVPARLCISELVLPEKYKAVAAARNDGEFMSIDGHILR